MKKYLPFVLLLLSLQALTQDFKVIGYLPYYRFGLSDMIDYSKLTHLNLAFANPDMEGNLSIGAADIDPVVQLAKQAGVKVSISLAGGALTPEWASAWEHLLRPDNRSAFIHKIMLYAQEHDLDGIDVDLEWSHVTEQYSGFVLELRDSVDQYDLLMTAALPGGYRYPDITDAAMLSYDFINMMVYDLTGPWAPNNPGQHSPYSFAVSSIAYWKNQGMPADRLTLGVPFYGRDFTNAPDNIVSFTYGSMIAENPAYAQLDQVGEAYYNGIPTIQAKTELALAEVSGIMIWEVGQDAFNEYSLLTAIDEVVNSTVAVDPVVELAGVEVFPNPFAHRITLANREDRLTYTLTNANGQLIRNGQIESQATLTLKAQLLAPGFYVLHITDGQQRRSLKLVKQ